VGVFAIAWGEVVVLLWASAIAALSIASTLWARSALNGVSVEVAFEPARAFVGEDVTLRVRITNDKRMPLPIVRLLVRFPFSLLPEAQLDRFLLRVKLGYPDEQEELRILQTQPADRTLPQEPLVDLPSLRELRDSIASIGLEHPVRSYVVSLARATRDHPELSVGASPRAVEQMGDAARAFAMLDGRDYVLPDDVKRLAEPVFGHRLVPTTDARIRDRDADEILREVLRSVPVPTELDT